MTTHCPFFRSDPDSLVGPFLQRLSKRQALKQTKQNWPLGEISLTRLLSRIAATLV